MANESLPERSIPDPSPGHAFIAIAHAGWRRHTKVLKIGCIGWWESSSVIATTRTSPLDSRLRGNDEFRGRNDEIAEWRGSTARSKAAWAHFRTNESNSSQGFLIL